MLFTKRRKFVLSAVLLSLGLLVTSFVPSHWRYWVILALGLLSAGLTLWGLWEDLSGAAWFMVPVLPSLYSSSVALFYFLLPERLLTRIAILTLFGIGMYAIFLTENIFSVAALRTIQLARAAQAVGFLFTLLTAFFLLDTIFSFKLAGWWNGLLVFLIALPLVLHSTWSIDLDEKLGGEVVEYGFLISWGLGQLGLMISFWPVTIVIASLFLVTAMYVCLGLIHNLLVEKLFKQTIREYVQVGVVVFILTFLVAKWGG